MTGETDAGPPALYTSCQALMLAEPGTPSGVHTLSLDGVATDVECDMTTDGGGWALLTRYDEDDPCPAGLIAAPRGCGRGTANTATTVITPVYAFTEMRGYVRALVKGGTDAFRDQSGTIDGIMGDGVSITIGQPRRHVFTFASGLGDYWQGNFATGECPCDGGRAPPSWVGNAYVCEAGYGALPDGTRVWDNDDVLFDGLDIADPSCVGHPDSASDFSVSVGPATSEPISVHVMQSQATSDEDMAIIAMELWTR